MTEQRQMPGNDDDTQPQQPGALGMCLEAWCAMLGLLIHRALE